MPRRSHADNEIRTIVEEIQTNYPGALVYLHQNLDKTQRIALWSESNCLIITSIKDGQCIPPLEFISVKKAEKTLEKSNVIMSEFSGCVKALGGILVINPFNIEEITRNIDLAL